MKSVLLCLLTAVGCYATDLSIVECDVRETQAGTRVLEAKIASTAAGPLDINKVQLRACIFERCSDSKITLAKPNVSFEWITRPVNWKNRSTERFEVTYPGPKPGSGTS